MEIAIYGHGSWKPNMGYFQLPRGCSVKFYTHFAKTLMPQDARKVLDGSYAGAIEREIDEFMTVPNLRCSPVKAHQRANAQGWMNGGARAGAAFYSPNAATDLESIVDTARTQLGLDGTYEFEWLCCQALKLEKSPLGGKAGVNARHYIEDQEFLLIDRFGGGKTMLGRQKATSIL